MTKSALFLLSAACAVVLAAGECPISKLMSDPSCPSQTRSGSDLCCEWDLSYNNASIYDRSVEFGNGNTLCRPLGFAFASWLYQKSPDINQPCVSLTCRDPPCYVQVAVETSPPGSLCVRENGANPRCGQGSFSACFPMNSQTSTSEYSFACEGGCSDGPVSFWYRFVTFTPQPGEDGNDLCGAHTVEYPSSLVNLPDGKDPGNNNPTIAPPRTSSAVSLAPLFALGVAALLSLFA